jgi:hypothetical protein
MPTYTKEAATIIISEVSKINVPLKATNQHTTEHLLEFALTMLDNARLDQNIDHFLPIIG